MMRSLFAAVSGLRAHQTRMDVIGNNVANVNTPGFKSSRATFQEVFSQTLRGASSPSDVSMTERGGMNPMQIGLGVTTGSIDVNHNSGNLQPTSRMADVAIEGKGFFVVQDGSTHAYTRVGAFDTDGDGILVDSEGRKVLGWIPDATGTIPADKSATNLDPIRIAIGSNMPAKATANIWWDKNLDAETPLGVDKRVPISIYDSLGVEHTLEIILEKADDGGSPPNPIANTWNWSVEIDGNPATTMGQGRIVFNPDGTLQEVQQFDGTDWVTWTTPGLTYDLTNGASDLSIALHFNSITQVAGASSLDAGMIDGWPTGTLESYTFDSKGVISGFYSNGQTRTLGQIAVANFANPGGLQKVGKSLFVDSNNSGPPDIGEAGVAGRGTIAPSSLEMSNVDLAEEFTQMIITQRGFQANSRIITVSDELLQELVNLKR
jgi:flagellar hook protein FlgE